MARSVLLVLCLAFTGDALQTSLLEATTHLPIKECPSTFLNSRRTFGKLVFSSLTAPALITAAASTPSFAATKADGNGGDLGAARNALLEAIDSKGSDASVMAAIEALQPFDPSQGKAATSPALAGTWELVWSAKAEAFSPLLRLPPPLRPASYQLLGPDATTEVGAGRVAQMLTKGVLGDNQLWLSSGVEPAKDPTQATAAGGGGESLLTTTGDKRSQLSSSEIYGDDGMNYSTSSVLEIFPPFRLQLAKGQGAAKQTIVEANSDSEFRAANARSEEAQAAPKNCYAQIYLDTSGLAGDLRISTIITGDPVIVGAVFVHRRL